MKSDDIITELLKNKRQSFENSVPTGDLRGKHAPKHKLKDPQKIVEYKSLTRKNASHRRYFNPDLTVKKMWDDYCDKHKDNPVSYITYFNYFKKENIGFSRPTVDGCEECLAYQNHISEFVVVGQNKNLKLLKIALLQKLISI